MSGRALIIQNDRLSGPGTLEQALHDAGWQIEFWLPFRDDQAVDVLRHDAVLAFGGRVDPRDAGSHPWLDREREMIGLLLECQIPYLGVCLGGELLAQVAGGSAPTEPPTELGWRVLEPTPAADADPLFRDIGRPVFEWHYNGIVAPERTTVLARTEGVDQAFRAGERAWGVQFHPEVDLDVVGLLTVLEPERLRAADVDPRVLRRETAERSAAYVAWSRTVLGAFLELVVRGDRR